MNAHHATVEGTVWPVNVGDIAWRFRYGTPSRSDFLVAAFVLSCYAHLTDPRLSETDSRAMLKRAREAAREATDD